ncbi:MAG: WG repeat-containing protein, partial [Myxococcales bacterium]|nr:WG repeat-containing protein [Myxococcales bacterium]
MPLLPFSQRRKVGLADETGQVHLPATLDEIGPLVDGVRTFRRELKRGWLDAEGHERVAARFSWLSDPAFGAAAAAETSGLYGLLALDGTWRSEPSWGWIQAVSESLALARVVGGKTTGLVEVASGTWRVEPTWTDARAAGPGRLAVKKGARWRGVSFEGEELVPARWSALQGQQDGTWLARESKQSAWVRLDATGEVVHTFGPDIEELGAYAAGHAAAKRGKEWGLVDADGRWVVEPCTTAWIRWDGVSPVPVFVARKFGYASPGAGLLVPARYDHASPFESGYAIADLDVLDASGQVVARVDPTSTPVIAAPPPQPKGRVAKALVASMPTRSNSPREPAVLGAIARLPDPDLAAVLHAWYTAGTAWIELGAWGLWSGTQATRL